MDRVFHTCNCLGQKFTQDQWCHSVRKEGVVFQYGEFGFNICDICITPRKAVDWKNKACHYVITTAQSPCGFWDYGLSCDTHNSGFGHGARFCKDETQGYPTEMEAIYAALKQCKERTERELKAASQTPDWDDEECSGMMKNSAAYPYLKAGLKQLEYYLELFNPAHITLF